MEYDIVTREQRMDEYVVSRKDKILATILVVLLGVSMFAK